MLFPFPIGFVKDEDEQGYQLLYIHLQQRPRSHTYIFIRTFTFVHTHKQTLKIIIYASRLSSVESRGVPKGGRVGRNVPPASENFVFFWSKSRKNEIFLLDLAKKGVAPPPALETSVRP
jgi:hypothetical protein